MTANLIPSKHTRYLEDVWALLDTKKSANPKPSHAPAMSAQPVVLPPLIVEDQVERAEPSPPEQGFEQGGETCDGTSMCDVTSITDALSQLDGHISRSCQEMADQLSAAQTEQLVRVVRQLVDFKGTIDRILGMQGEILDTLRTLTLLPQTKTSSASTTYTAHVSEPSIDLPPIGSPMLATALAKKHPQPPSKGHKGKGPKIPVLNKFR
eukprot:5776120-Amphidinium_carterae.5